uniref:Dynein axonemal intermediate chain 4 n=1 Tax=Periophthalmus magnuspinnatus TaxID=409849 RepID=A0A3B4AQ90_9GOBI
MCLFPLELCISENSSEKHCPLCNSVQVFDEEGNDVTPQPLHQGESGAGPPKSSLGLHQTEEKNKTYTEICKNRPGNEKYTERSAQTLHPQNKHKLTQSDSVTTTETGEAQRRHHRDSATSSMRDLEVCVSEAEVQSLLSGDTLLHSLMVMERSLVANTLQDKLAAYRLLPVLPAPQTSPEASGPALVHLWSFSCDLTLGRRVNSLVWNKNNPDLLAVGYGASESSSSAGLICCWSLKNPTWPERVVPCDSPVTALDFSVKSPCQLAVGMEDGTVMICSVHSPQSNTSVLHSRACPHKHVAPVLQVKWTLQDVGLRDDKDEALVSAATDGRICKWFVSNNGLDCTDMMKLKRVKSAKKLSTEKTTDTKPENILSALTPGMCVHFHPKESGVYLVGTWEGLIHKCSSSNTQQYMDTYKKHFGPVLGVSYSPLCPGVFLSCSSDWTVQLWTEERLTPALSLSSGHRAVLAVQWSPKAAAVFGAVSETGLEIWDLQSSILDPLVALAAPPSLSLTSLLFTSHTDCALVGDSGGRVCVYLLRDVYGTEGPQVIIIIIIHFICTALYISEKSQR